MHDLYAAGRTVFPYPWCQRLLRGLNEEARKKRIEITQLTNLEEKPSEFGCVLLIGATSSWVNTMAEKARAVGLHPIVMPTASRAPRRFRSARS